MENKKRFFAFGCSLTTYAWPTWADIVGHSLVQQGYEYHNLAVAGAGNVYIHTAITKAIMDYNITQDDIVMILWSSWTREDRFLDYGVCPDHSLFWSTQGNMLNSTFYDEQFINKYWSIEHDIIKNVNAIVSVNEMIDIDFQGHIMAVELAWYDEDDEEQNYEEILLHEHMQDMSLKNIFIEHMPDNEEQIDIDYVNRHDGHPQAKDAMEYVNKYIVPQTDITITDETVQFVNKWQKIMDDIKLDIDHPDFHCRDRFDRIYDKLFNEYELERSTILTTHAQDLWSCANMHSILTDFKRYCNKKT